MPKLKGIAKTRRQRKDGSFVEYHFAWRGGPCIWKTGDRHGVGDRDYEAAYHRAHGREPEKTPKVLARDIGRFQEVIRAFLGSDDYRGYSDAHKRDLEIWIPRVEAEFGDTVMGAFNDPRIKRVAEAWRRGLAPREADKAKFTLSRLVRFAIEDENFGLDYNHVRSLKTRYKCDRSAIVWRPEEIAVWMGWSLQYAGQMIATYARVDPAKTDATLVKLEPWLAQRAARIAAAK